MSTLPDVTDARVATARVATARRDRLRWPLLIAGATAGLTLALHLRDPHAQSSWGGCPWLALTGYYCPGCGVLRGVNDLSNGDVLAAASSNLVLVVLVPVLALAWWSWTSRAWSGTAPAGGTGPTGIVTRHPAVAVALAAALMVAFTVLRNLPGSWLAP